MKKVLKFLVFTMAMAVIVMLVAVYYVFTVVDNMVMSRNMRYTFDQIESSIESSESEVQQLMEQFADDNRTKAKALSIILYQTPAETLSMNSLEELRVTFDADEIFITDAEGIVVTATSAFTGSDIHSNDTLSAFVPALSDKTFRDSINIYENGMLTQYVCAPRRDSSGVIIVKANTKYISQTMQYASISSILSENLMLEKGQIFIFDANDWAYVGSSEASIIGQSVQISKDKFDDISEEEIKKFKITSGGEKQMLYYKQYGDNIIGISIYLKSLYLRRNYVVGCVFVVSVILMTVAFLAVRNKMLSDEK